MHEWPITPTETMTGWIERLKSFNVYFSAPLDLDFLLLENYPDCYKGTVEEGYGPYIPVLGKISVIEAISPLPQQYLDRADANTRDVLKDEGGDGSTYLEKQKHLMIWYKYLFLDRSKPVTHLKALSSCDFSNLETIPEPLRTIISKVTDAL
jgi:hypothetical protein